MAGGGVVRTPAGINDKLPRACVCPLQLQCMPEPLQMFLEVNNSFIKKRPSLPACSRVQRPFSATIARPSATLQPYWRFLLLVTQWKRWSPIYPNHLPHSPLLQMIMANINGYMVAQYLLSNSKIWKSFKEEKASQSSTYGDLCASSLFLSPLNFFFWICYHSTCAYHQEHNVFCVDSEESSEPRESTRTQALHWQCNKRTQELNSVLQSEDTKENNRQKAIKQLKVGRD